VQQIFQITVAIILKNFYVLQLNVEALLRRVNQLEHPRHVEAVRAARKINIHNVAGVPSRIATDVEIREPQICDGLAVTKAQSMLRRARDAISEPVGMGDLPSPASVLVRAIDSARAVRHHHIHPLCILLRHRAKLDDL